MNNNSNKILAFILSMIIMMFSLLFIFNKKIDFSENENRYLQEIPKFRLDKLIDGKYIEDLFLEFDKTKILIIGKNAQGKTNILESIYFLSTLKTPRTSNLSELIKFNSEYFKIEADIVKADTDVELTFVYNIEKKC